MSDKKFKNQFIEMLVFISLILVGFKLSGSIIAIDWSWWLVFSPISLLVLNYMIIGFLLLNKFYHIFIKDNNHNSKKKGLYKIRY